MTQTLSKYVKLIIAWHHTPTCTHSCQWRWAEHGQQEFMVSSYGR